MGEAKTKEEALKAAIDNISTKKTIQITLNDMIMVQFVDLACGFLGTLAHYCLDPWKLVDLSVELNKAADHLAKYKVKHLSDAQNLIKPAIPQEQAIIKP
jgi:hypothetical protein